MSSQLLTVPKSIRRKSSRPPRREVILLLAHPGTTYCSAAAFELPAAAFVSQSEDLYIVFGLFVIRSLRLWTLAELGELVHLDGPLPLLLRHLSPSSSRHCLWLRLYCIVHLQSVGPIVELAFSSDLLQPSMERMAQQ